MPRFFVDRKDVGDAFIYITDPGDMDHIRKVLRLREGDRIQVSDSAAYEYEAEIESMSPCEISARILDKQQFLREPSLKVTLFQGLPKQGKMETIVQKCVELGVDTIVPVYTARTVVTDKGKGDKKQQRWQKVAAEAVKQCGRGLIPQVRESVTFKEMCKELGGEAFDLCLFLYENEEKQTLKQCLNRYKEHREKTDDRVAIIIGPEGGFSDGEAEAMQQLAASASLGKTILRTETAGPAALAMVMYELEME